MPSWLQWSLIFAGIIAIICLFAFITKQSGILRKHKQVEQRKHEFQNRRRQDMVESIRIIAMAVEQDQVEYSEACLRLKGLLDHVAPELLVQPPYRIFQELHDQLQHMPTHRARQQTDQRFVKKMDEERFALEQSNADAIRRAATAIRLHNFD